MRIENRQRKYRRKRKVRSKIYGDGKKPRLSVFRSNKFIYAQVIDDVKGKTLFAICDKDVIKQSKVKLSKIETAKKSGILLTEKALKLRIKNVVFDRNGYAYKGRVKAFAKGARGSGLKF